MNSGWLALTALLLCFAAVLAIFFQWVKLFLTKPIHASIRALLGLMSLLLGALQIPTIAGKATLSVDWGAFLVVNGSEISFSSGGSWEESGLALASVTLLLLVCFFRVPGHSAN